MFDRMPVIKPSKLVAIVVPLSNRKELTSDEKISLKHLEHHLGKYDKFMLIPESLDFNYPGFGIKRFANNYFGSTDAHRKLILSRKLYKTFLDYKFILFYHLDSLVFSDQLIEWCKRDYDYIAAPWVAHKDAPYAENSVYAGKVGNGGFTLKKVRGLLKVLYSDKLYKNPKDYWEKYYVSKSKFVQFLNLYKKYLKMMRVKNSVRSEIKKIGDQNGYSVELFWAYRANHYYPDFKIPSVETALKFAFECVPRYCYELNGKKLPFGCHAWQKYDRTFWEQFMLS